VFNIKLDFLIILGGRFYVGWPDNPMLSEVNIKLLGNSLSPAYLGLDGNPIGTKAIGTLSSQLLLEAFRLMN